MTTNLETNTDTNTGLPLAVATYLFVKRWFDRAAAEGEHQSLSTPSERDNDMIIVSKHGGAWRGDRVTLQALRNGLQQARVFDVPREVAAGRMEAAIAGVLMMEFGREARVDTTESLIEFLDSVLWNDNTKAQFTNAVWEIAGKTAFPAPLPFKSVFLSYGDGVQVRSAHVLEGDIDDQLRIMLVGTLLVEDELIAHTVVIGRDQLVLDRIVNTDGELVQQFESERFEVSAVYAQVCWRAGNWTSVLAVEPVFINGIIGDINASRTTVLEDANTFKYRRDYEKVRKNMKGRPARPGPVPPPFYTVKLRPVTYDLRGKAGSDQASRDISSDPQERVPSGPRAAPSYRHDVRTHERCRIARGARPMPDEVRDKLAQRGYTVYDYAGPADVILRDTLAERGLPEKGMEEWIAVKRKLVSSFISPKNPALPYVPSLHKLEKDR